MTKFYQPNYALSSAQAQDDFVFWAYSKIYNLAEKISESYRRNFDAPWNAPRPTLNLNTHYAQIEEMFTLGRYVYRVLNCTYAEFKVAILRRQGVYPGFYQVTIHKSFTRVALHAQLGRYREYVSYTTWYDYHGTDFRQPLKYVRQAHILPKEVTEEIQSRADWREAKGFERDYRRQHRGYASKRKGFAKTQSNRTQRQMERAFIHQERWEEIPTYASKYIFDAWMWD